MKGLLLFRPDTVARQFSLAPGRPRGEPAQSPLVVHSASSRRVSAVNKVEMNKELNSTYPRDSYAGDLFGAMILRAVIRENMHSQSFRNQRIRGAQYHKPAGQVE